MKLKENHTSEDEFDTDEEMPIFPKVVQPLKCFKLFPEAHLPVLGSEWSACFDLKASFRSGDICTYCIIWWLSYVSSYRTDIRFAP